MSSTIERPRKFLIVWRFVACAATCSSCALAAADEYRDAYGAPPRVLAEGSAPAPTFWGTRDAQAAPDPRADWRSAEAQRLQQTEHQESAPPEPMADAGGAASRIAPGGESTLSPPKALSRSTLPGDKMPALVTAGGSLAIVVGLFLIVAWVVRRGMPRSVPLLPTSALEVMGRSPLVGKQQVHLVRCGNKVLLLHASTSGVSTLTEIADPAEVERLTEICQGGSNRAAGGLTRRGFRYDDDPQSFDYPLQQTEEDVDFSHLASPRGRVTHA